MIDIVEAQYKKVAQGIDALTNVIKDGNCVSNKLHEVAKRQVAMAERQVQLPTNRYKLLKKDS